MKYYTIDTLEDIKSPVCLAMGVFDGLHIGHQAVIKEAVDAAINTDAQIGLLTFSPHPIKVLAPDKAPQPIVPDLTIIEPILAELGVDFMVVVNFDTDFSQLTYQEFIEQLHNACFDLRLIAVGQGWKFGYKRQGNPENLTALGLELGFEVKTAQIVKDNNEHGQRVSSTRIRSALSQANLSLAESLLGRTYSYQGLVEHGEHLGAELQARTANIKLHPNLLLPTGVYIVTVIIKPMKNSHQSLGYNKIQGVANLGYKPTLGKEFKHPRLEVHLLNWSGDLYGKTIEVFFHHYIRPEKKFSNLDELRKQIHQDIEDSHNYFNTTLEHLRSPLEGESNS